MAALSLGATGIWFLTTVADPDNTCIKGLYGNAAATALEDLPESVSQAGSASSLQSCRRPESDDPSTPRLIPRTCD